MEAEAVPALAEQVRLFAEPHGLTHAPGYNPWAIARELPAPPKQSFREWYAQHNPKPGV